MSKVIVVPSNHRMPELEKVAAPVNTRTFLYHATRDPIVVEGEGKTDEERIASRDEKIEEKLKAGYTRERHHGQHPHSNDDHRIEHQQIQAAKGDKKAKAALEAKAKVSSKAGGAKTDEELRLENELLKERLAEWEAASKK